MRNGGKLRTTLLFLLIALFVAALFLVPAWEQNRREELEARLERQQHASEVRIACAGRRSDIEILEALDQVTNMLGLPGDTVVVPELPEDCQ